jgi:hypothetical protein
MTDADYGASRRYLNLDTEAPATSHGLSHRLVHPRLNGIVE